MPTQTCRTGTITRLAHDFDPHSGWCLNGCGSREDGRRINPVSGNVLVNGPTYTSHELAMMTARARYEETSLTLL